MQRTVGYAGRVSVRCFPRCKRLCDDWGHMGDFPTLRAQYHEQGFVVVRKLLPPATIARLRRHAEEITGPNAQRLPTARLMQTAYARNGAVRLIKVSGLTEADPLFRDVATHHVLVDVVEALLGTRARRYRDVLICKPARTGGALSYHQDSAYWDVEPKALVSCWIGLGDVSEQASCLRVIPKTHLRETDHGTFLRGRYELPRAITRGLRQLVSLAGTGDNPDAGGSEYAWRAKRWVLANSTRYLPVLFDLQDLRIPPRLTADHPERLLPVEAGDVIFFHSLLWHASGPNETDQARFAEIVSFMPHDANVPGSVERWPLARTAR